MEKEKFCLYLNSNQASDNSNLNNASYNVNWQSFLPNKYKKFNVKCFMQSEVGANLTQTGTIQVRFGHIQSHSGTNYTSILGIVKPEFLSGTSFYFFSHNNSEVSVEYPTSNYFEVEYRQFNNSFMTEMTNYVLCLEFTPLP